MGFDGRPVWVSSDPFAMPVVEVASPYDGLPVRLLGPPGDPYAGQPIREGEVDLYKSTPVWNVSGAPLFDRWAPADLGASLIAWWNADSLANGAVAAWPDTILGLNPAQATGAAQPIRAASSFNSAYAGVTFDGTDDVLSVESITGLPAAGTASMLWVLATPAAGGTRVIFRYGTTFRGLDRGGGVGRASDGTVTASGSAWDTVPYLIMGEFNPTTYTLWTNGVAGTPAAGATLNTSGARTRIGASTAAAPAAFWSGVIRHILVTSILSASDRQKLEGFLAWNSGLQTLLPLDHPYRTVPP